MNRFAAETRFAEETRVNITRRSVLIGAVGGGCVATARLASGQGAAANAANSANSANAANAAEPGAIRSLRHDSQIKADDGREVRISVWPAWGAQRGVILFSHGALSSPEKYERVIGPWNAAGFQVMAPLHVDSTDHPDHAKYGMLDSWRARLLDLRALAHVADAPSFIAAGHSYGGLVALTLGGASAEVPPGLTAPLRDTRVSAVVAFSPPGAAPGLLALDGYRTLAVPTWIQTGDRDVPFDSKDGRWQGHLAAYEAAPPGDKYALVLQGVDHYFGGLICKYDVPGPAQAAQLTAAVGSSTLFMDAYATRDLLARSLLDESLRESGAAQLRRK